MSHSETALCPVPLLGAHQEGLHPDSWGHAFWGGDTGPATVPGERGASRFLRRVNSKEWDERMPSKAEPPDARDGFRLAGDAE
jgi:hypothetical protein